MKASDVFANEKTVLAYEHWAAMVKRYDAARFEMEIAIRQFSSRDNSSWTVDADNIRELAGAVSAATVAVDLAKQALSLTLRDEPSYGAELKEQVSKVAAAIEAVRAAQ